MQPERPYEVGYQKPPQQSRFKPGQSGNPHARQKAGRDFAKLFSQALDQTITVTEDGAAGRSPSARPWCGSSSTTPLKGTPRRCPGSSA